MINIIELKNYIKKVYRPEFITQEFIVREEREKYNPRDCGMGFSFLVVPKPAESFVHAVDRLIDEKGMTRAQCYRRAGIRRDTFSKIMNEVNKPSKDNAIRIALALRMSLPEAQKLLEKAGYSLSKSILQDCVLRYCFENGEYDLIVINNALDDLMEEDEYSYHVYELEDYIRE